MIWGHTRTTALWVVPNMAAGDSPPVLFASVGLAEVAYHHAFLEGTKDVLPPVEVVVLSKSEHRSAGWWMVGLFIFIGLTMWHDRDHHAAGHHDVGGSVRQAVAP